ncbi:carbohydrate ABC transporter permease [Marinitoga sp. 38H-ov]|uniref:carbohydrate ABC transporter permease n=1 Tax=Marinitoga sp. 38H-ov TaxID=1755814 RepID=UPI0013EE3650|nr:carbohydrate ABC transporter permease [Marinitoga sp. 38H-ov]KAF2955429.1 ABC transporter permease [Marinitoga sp. 38H-ov]
MKYRKYLNAKRYLNTKILIYVILIGVGYAYLYPMLYMISTSFMSSEDLINPTIRWLPVHPSLRNFRLAFDVLEVTKTFFNSVYLSLVPAILQTLSTAIIAYGLARFEFPLKKLFFVLVLLTFLIPAQTTLVTKYMLFSRLKIAGTPLASFLPTLFGQGIKSTIFILLYYNFFSMLPRALDEAAEIDGATQTQIFWKIMLPLSIPAIVTTFIFSLVWYWNETLLSGLLVGNSLKTLPLALRDFVAKYAEMFPSQIGNSTNRLNEGIRMAATLITILPLLITYLFLQRQFIESIEKAGITGE